MPENNGVEQYKFIQPEKNEIFVQASSEVYRQLVRVAKFPIEERSKMAFGLVFEAVAVKEYHPNSNETEQQQSTRDLIQELFNDAEYSLGEKFPSKPDYVSVRFDDKLGVVIDEIVEMKTSEQALKHAVEKRQSQPQNTIETIEKVVALVNSMIQAEDVSQVDAINRLNPNTDRYRKKYLTAIYQRVKGLGLKQGVTFSPSLRYRIILPKDTDYITPDFKVNHDGKPINVIVTKSNFTRRDVHNIIEHHSENSKTKFA